MLYNGPEKWARTYSRFMVFLAIFFLIPLVAEMIWPAGLIWSDGRSNESVPSMLKAMYVALSICIVMGARDPLRNAIIIDYTIISSIIHGLVMLWFALELHHEHAHLYGDVPLLLIAAAGLSFYHPRRLARKQVQQL